MKIRAGVSVASQIRCCSWLLIATVILVPVNAAVVVSPGELADAEGGGKRYTYSLYATRLMETGIEQAESVRNMAVQKQGGTVFVHAEPGKQEAELVYAFDFSRTAYGIASVNVRDNLALFDGGEADDEDVTAYTEWSADGDAYKTLTTASTAGTHENQMVGNPAGNTVDVPGLPQTFFYRVRMVLHETDADGVMTAARNQWNRSGENAAMFRVRFALKPRKRAVPGKGRTKGGDGSAGSLAFTVEHPERVPHIAGDLTYPDSALQVESADHWRFGGAVRGHRGGVRLVEAPGRAGKALQLWVEANKEREDAPDWLFWQRPLDPELFITGTEHIDIDVMPLDPIDFRITARFGSGDGLGVVPATWSSLGKLKTGQWQTVSIPIHHVRPHIDTLRFDMRVHQPGVPHRKRVRFLVDRFRFVPSSDPVTARFVDGMKVNAPLRAAYLGVTSQVELADDEALTFQVETHTAAAQNATLEVNAHAGGAIVKQWSTSVELAAPYTVIRAELDALAMQLPVQEASLAVRISGADGEPLAQTTDPIPVRLFRSDAFTADRKQVWRRWRQLMQAHRKLTAEGRVANLPGVSLAVAELFLRDGGFLEDDFERQREYGKARYNLNQVSDLLDRADEEIGRIGAGSLHEPRVPSFDPSVPVIKKDGMMWQNGQPIVFIGGIGWKERLAPLSSRLTERLGFNAASVQARLREWFDNTTVAREHRAATWMFLDESRRAGLAANLLISGHYAPTRLPERYRGAMDSGTGSSMLPWNLAAPQTRKIYADWYEQLLPMLEGKTHLVNVETANEPNHSVRRGAPHYAEQFRQWARDKHESIDAANRLWGTEYADFNAIELPALLNADENHPGLLYDWNRFRTDIETDFFRFLKNRIRAVHPDLDVTLKLMGHLKHFGYPLLNEQTIVTEAQTLIGTDGSDPMWQDYLKSMKPEAPIINAEWHFLSGGVVENRAVMERRMFDGIAHGIGFGAIWNFRRKDWDSLSNGAEQSMTRYPVTLDTIGRTTWRLRAIAAPLGRFANQDGGRIRLLYAINSDLHGGEPYIEGLEAVYRQVARNSSGVRFLIPAHMTSQSLHGVELVAAGAASHIAENARTALSDWVQAGGTLWLTEPGLQRTPYDTPHPSGSAFSRATSTVGSHAVGSGTVIVAAETPALQPFLDAPWAIDSSGEAVTDVVVRRTSDGQQPAWMYVMNRSDHSRTVRLAGWPGVKELTDAEDIWSRVRVDLSETIQLAPHQVILVQLP